MLGSFATDLRFQGLFDGGERLGILCGQHLVKHFKPQETFKGTQCTAHPHTAFKELDENTIVAVVVFFGAKRDASTNGVVSAAQAGWRGVAGTLQFWTIAVRELLAGQGAGRKGMVQMASGMGEGVGWAATMIFANETHSGPMNCDMVMVGAVVEQVDLDCC
jgi:hypothetical protein